MVRTPDFESTLQSLPLPLTRYIQSIQGTRDAFSWTQADLDDIAREREFLGPNCYALCRFALVDSLHELPAGSTVVDWGIGEGKHYPLDPALQHLNIIGIDPQVDAFNNGVSQGRIPVNASHIARESPPYDEIDLGSLQAVIAISSLHVLPESKMTEVISDLSRRLGPGGLIVALQDITPSPDFLLGVTHDRLIRMTEYIKNKYGFLQLKPGSIRKSGGFWGEYHKRTTEDVRRTQGVEISVDRRGELRGTFTPNIPYHPNVDIWENVVDWLLMLARLQGRYGGKNMTEKDIESFLRVQGDPELFRLILATHRLAKLIAPIPIDEVDDMNLREWTLAVMQVVSSLSQDVYEAYLVTVLEEFGFEVVADRVGVVSVYDNVSPDQNSLTYIVDGAATIRPHQNDQGAMVVSTVRRVRARTK